MYMNKPSVAKIEAAERLIFCIILAAASESKDLENLDNCFYRCPDMRHFMIVTKKYSCFQT